MGENTRQNCTRQNKKKNPGRQQPCWGSLFCTNLTQPTGNLDSKSTENVMEYLVDINRKFKITLVMVTHDSYAASFCDKVILLKDGIQFLEIEKNNKSNSIFLKDIYELLKRIGGE